jgi:hypothetical protein
MNKMDGKIRSPGDIRLELTGRLPLDGLEVIGGRVSMTLPPMLLMSLLILSMPRSSRVLGLKSDLGFTEASFVFS